MKNKLNPIRTHDRSPPRSLLSTSEMAPLRPGQEARSVLPQLSVPKPLPIHSHILDSPNRLMETPIYSAVSPVGPFQPGAHDFPSFSDASDADRSPRHRRRTNSDDATSNQGSLDYNGAEDMEMDDAVSLKRFRGDDSYTAAVGHKRRAPSPADDHMMHGITTQGDFVRRREGLSSRGSPTPRLSIPPTPKSSLTSTSRSNSYISTANSYGRRSPGGLSPGGLSPISCSSPYNAPVSLNQSPRASISGRSHAHVRAMSGAGMTAKKLTEGPKAGGKRFLMCECCPKKPKKFETAEELR
jgi:hypothetical protein